MGLLASAGLLDLDIFVFGIGGFNANFYDLFLFFDRIVALFTVADVATEPTVCEAPTVHLAAFGPFAVAPALGVQVVHYRHSALIHFRLLQVDLKLILIFVVKLVGLVLLVRLVVHSLRDCPVQRNPLSRILKRRIIRTLYPVLRLLVFKFHLERIVALFVIFNDLQFIKFKGID